MLVEDRCDQMIIKWQGKIRILKKIEFTEELKLENYVQTKRGINTS